MTDRDPRTLDVIHEISRTADRLARRMGGEYVLDGQWKAALTERVSVRTGLNSGR